MDDFEKLINASDLIEWIMETYPDWCVGDVRSIVDHVIDLPSVQTEIVRCKDCKWFGDIGCAIRIVDDSDKPTENDFCSFAERRDDE